MIYLDNAATTYPKPECVYQTLDKANRHAFNSGRGGYKVAREATQLVDKVRNKILEVNDIRSGKVVFSTSATIALNHLIFGIDLSEGDNIYISPFEHNSVIRPLEALKKYIKINILMLPFNKETWELEEEKMQDMFALNKPKAIIISHISNTTGFLLPYQTIFRHSKKYNAVNILDSSQGYGIVTINNLSDIHYIVFAGHKSLYASFGIAGYIKLKNDKLKHCLFGGTGSDTMNPFMSTEIPDGYEAGSLNIVAISSLETSLIWLQSTDIYNHEQQLTNYLIEQLKTIPKCHLYLPKDETKVFGIVSINVDGYQSEEVGNILDEEFDICLRTGFHCAPKVHNFISSIENNGTVRISLNYFNTQEEIDRLITALKTL